MTGLRATIAEKVAEGPARIAPPESPLGTTPDRLDGQGEAGRQAT